MRSTWVLLKDLVHLMATAPWLATTELSLVVVVAVAGPMQSYGVAQVVDGITRGESILHGAVILFIALVVTLGGTVITDAVRNQLEDKMEFALQERLLELATVPHGIAHHEQPDVADRFGAVREDVRRLKGTVGTIGGGLSVLVSTGTVLVLLGDVHVLLLLLPLVGLIRLWASGSGAKALRLAIRGTMQHTRRYKRLMEVARDPRHGLEIRSAGIRSWLTDQIADIVSQQNIPRWRATQYGGILEIISRALFGAGYGLAILFTIGLMYRGDATPGDVALVIMLAGQTDQSAQRMAQSTASLVGMLDVVRSLRWLREHFYYLAATEAQSSSPSPDVLKRGITLENVSFRYPGTARPSINGISAHLPAGSTIALVGANGAGKTTLVKLLSQLYRPTAGIVLVDGTDLSSIDPAEWRKRISVGFQDFVKYQYTAREAVGLAEPDLLRAGNDSPDAYASAIDAGDANDLIANLPKGLDTRLGSEFGGIELSGGQWQRLALARTFFRKNPLLVVLDEPAASLDPESEHLLIERFHRASRSTRKAGGITLLISHRLSSARMADLIMVFEDGELVEFGSHEALSIQGGVYAELYSIQSAAYQ
jgi:ATP-binding cassette, subfamily B, bacterial